MKCRSSLSFLLASLHLALLYFTVCSAQSDDAAVLVEISDSLRFNYTLSCADNETALCDADGNVLELRLFLAPQYQYYPFTYFTLPESLGKLTSLKKLTLSSGRIEANGGLQVITQLPALTSVLLFETWFNGNVQLNLSYVAPSIPPTSAPTTAPTNAPTLVPAMPFIPPTLSPTDAPTNPPVTPPPVAPTANPTTSPTVAPTSTPTNAPTQAPTDPPIARKRNYRATQQQVPSIRELTFSNCKLEAFPLLEGTHLVQLHLSRNNIRA